MHVYKLHSKTNNYLDVIIVFQNKSSVFLGHKENEILIEN